MSPSYIHGVGVCLPNQPVENDDIERVLGLVDGAPSRTRRLILRNNGIRTRYYAVDPVSGRQTHTNARLAAESVRALVAATDSDLDLIDCLACGTSTPDQFIPGHAPMVHGELGNRPCELVSTAGVCLSGLSALKYAHLSVCSGEARTAVATGSELVSNAIRGAHLTRPPATRADQLEAEGIRGFGQEFLRWMLSDGAGAVLVSFAPRPAGLSLRIDWIEIVSYANQLETCMYWGARKLADGSLVGWREVGDTAEALQQGLFNISQDVRLLGKEISYRSVNVALGAIKEKRALRASDVDWFLPHYSSEYFRAELAQRLEETGFPIPFDRWVTNLTEKGNTGSASIYIMLDELVRTRPLSAGQRVLCFVPESARFSAGYMLLTVLAS